MSIECQSRSERSVTSDNSSSSSCGAGCSGGVLLCESESSGGGCSPSTSDTFCGFTRLCSRAACSRSARRVCRKRRGGAEGTPRYVDNRDGSPGSIADQWECEDLDRTTKTIAIGREEFWYEPRILLTKLKIYLLDSAFRRKSALPPPQKNRFCGNKVRCKLHVSNVHNFEAERTGQSKPVKKRMKRQFCWD